ASRAGPPDRADPRRGRRCGPRIAACWWPHARRHALARRVRQSPRGGVDPVAVQHLADGSRAVPGGALRDAAGARPARDDLRLGRRAGNARCDARVSRDGGVRQLPPAHRRLEDQWNVERLDRRRLVHPRGHCEAPAARRGGWGRSGAGDMSGAPTARRKGEARGAVVVMAKAPREGFVKTRLNGAYPPCDVVQLSECMLRDTVARLQELARVQVAVVCPSEDVDEIAGRFLAGVDVVGQLGHGLAAALLSAFELFLPDSRRVIAVDSDSPHLPLAILDSAFELLETNDVVVGPTEDGGYYLVGASAIHPHLFDPASLGTVNARDTL